MCILGFFLIGLFFYKKETPNRENILLKVIGCVCHAAHQKIKGNSKGIPWIRGAVGKYSEPFINDVSIFLKVDNINLGNNGIII